MQANNNYQSREGEREAVSLGFQFAVISRAQAEQITLKKEEEEGLSFCQSVQLSIDRIQCNFVILSKKGQQKAHEITRLRFQCRAIFPKILRSGHHLHVILILAAAFLLLLNNRRFQIGRGHHIIIILCVAWAPAVHKCQVNNNYRNFETRADAIRFYFLAYDMNQWWTI